MQKAQSTIEYLVIIAVIIVIGLVIVAISSNFVNSDTGLARGKINSKVSSTIIIADGAFDESTGYVTLKNINYDSLTITKISSGANDNNYDKKIEGSETITFKLTDFPQCACDGYVGNKECAFDIYTTKNGIQAKQTIFTIINCQSTVSTPNSYVNELSCLANVAEPIDCSGLSETYCESFTGCTAGYLGNKSCIGGQLGYGDCDEGLAKAECNALTYCEHDVVCQPKDCSDFIWQECPTDYGCTINISYTYLSCNGSFNCSGTTNETACDSTASCSWGN